MAIITPIFYLNLFIAFLFDKIYLKTEIQIHEIIGSIMIVGVVFVVTILKALGIVK